MQQQAQKQIIIVGGGTAGWMAANMLAHQTPPGQYRVTVVESSDIPSVGVGEGSTPFFKQFFDDLGIAEQEWMPACHATYKTGIAFPGWLGDNTRNTYFHPFYNEIDAQQVPIFFAACDARRQGYAIDAHPDDYFVTGHLYQHQQAPVFGGAACDYGFHFDAAKLAAYLRQLALSRGVVRIAATVQQVNKHLSGAIAQLQLDNGETLSADLFIDCTGFRGLLIRQAMQRTFVSLRDYLHCDAAVAFPVNNAGSQVQSATVSEAIDEGWVWTIPLTHRTGSGLVYSRAHTSEQQALDVLMHYHGMSHSHATEPVVLSWEPGHLSEHWYQNCVAIGLSQGFLEPLEAPMLNLTQQSVQLLIGELHKHSGPDPLAFNRQVNNMMAGTRDYLQAHYLLNQRQGRFWTDVRHNPHRSDALQDMLDAWRTQRSVDRALRNHIEKQVYQKTSWYCLFSGLRAYAQAERAVPQHTQAIVDAAKDRAFRMAQSFPDHATALNKMNNQTMGGELNIA